MLDELLEVYLVFQTPFQDEASLRSLFHRLSVSLQARASGFVLRASSGKDASAEGSSSRVEDIIWSATIDTSEEPTIVVQESSRQESVHRVYAIWRTTVLLSTE